MTETETTRDRHTQRQKERTNVLLLRVGLGWSERQRATDRREKKKRSFVRGGIRHIERHTERLRQKETERTNGFLFGVGDGVE